MFEWKIKSFSRSDSNVDLRWVHTPAAYSIFVMSDPTSRRSLNRNVGKIEYMRLRDSDIIAFVTSSGDHPYRVAIDFLHRQMSCECESFHFRESPCKHVMAVVAHAVQLKENLDDYTPEDFVSAALAESRNAALQKMPWEDKPSFDPEVAAQYDYTVVTVRLGRRDVTGYMVENSKVWTGPLPLPEPGERIMAHLPTGEKIEATILERDEEHRTYLGFLVRLDEKPKGYSSDTIVLMGSEVVRTKEIITDTKEKRLNVLAEQQGVSIM